MLKRKKNEEKTFSYWKSYSDIMAALLLMFILLLAAIMYQNLIVDDDDDASYTSAVAAQAYTIDIEALQAQIDDLQELQSELQAENDQLSSENDWMEDYNNDLLNEVEDMYEKSQRYDEQLSQLDNLIGIKKDLIEELNETFEESKLEVNVDQNTGAIILAASVLFDYDKYTLKESAKKYLDEFLPTYFRVLLDDKYLPYISEIIIEGNTDQVGSYLYNLNLSQKRALSIASYCFQDDNHLLVQDELSKLRSILTANGRSWSNLIYDEDGNVDAQLSRRVEFKFRLVNEELIDEMKEILEG